MFSFMGKGNLVVLHQKNRVPGKQTDSKPQLAPTWDRACRVLPDMGDK